MRLEQERIIKLAAVSLSCLLIGSAFQTWDNYSPGLAFILTLIYTGSYAYIVTAVRHSYSHYYMELDQLIDGDEGITILSSTQQLLCCRTAQWRDINIINFLILYYVLFPLRFNLHNKILTRLSSLSTVT